MIVKTFGTFSLAACVGLAMAPAAQASCIQADAAGVWQVYSLNDDGDVTSCEVAVNAAMSWGDAC